MRVLFAILIVLITSGCSSLNVETPATAFETWRKVYAHDETGATIEGSKDELIEAVRNGKPIRVYTASSRVEHAMDAGFLTIFEDEVFAQIHPIESQRPAVDPPRILYRQVGQKWRTIIGTNGHITALMDGNEPRERTGGAVWFVQD